MLRVACNIVATQATSRQGWGRPACCRRARPRASPACSMVATAPHRPIARQYAPHRHAIAAWYAASLRCAVRLLLNLEKLPNHWQRNKVENKLPLNPAHCVGCMHGVVQHSGIYGRWAASNRVFKTGGNEQDLEGKSSLGARVRPARKVIGLMPCARTCAACARESLLRFPRTLAVLVPPTYLRDLYK
jgi:hypothetical protein